MAVEWKQPTIDAAIAVAGGGILANLAANVPQISGLLDGLPVFMGISVKAIIYGAVALIVAKHFMK